MERDQLNLIMSEKGLEASGVAENNTSSLSSLQGVDALVILNAQTTNKTKYSMFGGAKLNSVIKTASARVINVQNGEMIMTVNLDYKNGQDAGNAAQTMAKALKVKLNGEDTETTAKN
jgi:folate-binding Fe-S cluster repair protein YgfZ